VKNGKFFDDKVVLVTGGTGSIGGALVRRLLSLDISKVVLFSRDETKHFTIRRMLSDSRLDTVIGDVRDPSTMEDMFETMKFDVVFHAAAMKHVTLSEFFAGESAKTNVIGTQNIVHLARKHHVPVLMNVSTDKAVYPTSVLGASKLMAERIVTAGGFCSVRFGNVAGSRGSVIPVLLGEMASHRRLTITDGNVTRFLMRPDEAVDLVLGASEVAHGGNIYVAGMKSFKLSELVKVFVNDIAPELGLKPSSIDVKEEGLLKGEKLHEEILTEEEVPKLYSIKEVYTLTSDAKWVRAEGAKKVESFAKSSATAPRLTHNELKGIVSQAAQEHMGLATSWKGSALRPE